MANQDDRAGVPEKVPAHDSGGLRLVGTYAPVPPQHSAVQHAFIFGRDGRFLRVQLPVAPNGAAGNSPTGESCGESEGMRKAVTTGASGSCGTYRIRRGSLELRYDDGRGETITFSMPLRYAIHLRHPVIILDGVQHRLLVHGEMDRADGSDEEETR